MKGNEKIVERLNAMLSDELAAANQYILHAEICENWLYGKLLDSILSDEEAHIDAIEGQRDQISQMGIATYLGQQM